MWVIADTTQGFYLEYWLFPERRCVVSLKADVDLGTLEDIMMLLRGHKVVPR